MVARESREPEGCASWSLGVREFASPETLKDYWPSTTDKLTRTRGGEGARDHPLGGRLLADKFALD